MQLKYFDELPKVLLEWNSCLNRKKLSIPDPEEVDQVIDQEVHELGWVHDDTIESLTMVWSNVGLKVFADT